MSVLSHEELMNLIRAHIGDDNSESSISLLENVSDTIEDLEQKATLAENTVPKAELDKANEMWAQKYKDRFCNPDLPPITPPTPKDETNTEITINDLFK